MSRRSYCRLFSLLSLESRAADAEPRPIARKKGNGGGTTYPSRGSSMVAGGPNDEMMPRWSPDGSKIAFLSDDGSGMNVYWVPPTGGSRRKVAETRFQYLDRFTAISVMGSQPWSPDGSELVFSRLEATGLALWKVELSSGEETRLTTPAAGTLDVRAAWSHDGEWIAFMRQPGRPPFGLYLISASGGEPIPLVVSRSLNGSPNWGLDDRRILLTTTNTPNGGGDIWDVDVDTGELRQLTNGLGASTCRTAEFAEAVLCRADVSEQIDWQYVQSLVFDSLERISKCLGERERASLN